MEESTYEYELIDIEFLDDSEQTGFAREDIHTIEYDEDGIPMCESIPEIEQRKIFINGFFEKWGKENPDRCIYNDKIEDNIYVRGISVIEAKEHSSKSYNSTRAIMIIDKVLKNASPIRRAPTKADNKNQKESEHMLVMVYKHPDIGTIKLTLGVRKSNKKIQYGLTALRSGQPLIDEFLTQKSAKQNTKKRRPHK